MKTIDDSDEDPNANDLFAKIDRIRVKPFRKQYYSPDYIEDYPWDSFDPSFANKLDLAFAALPPAEQFLRLPKGIVENVDSYLTQTNLAALLTWLGDHGKAQDQEYLNKVEDSQRTRAWGIAKRFNRTLERMREKITAKLSKEEIERLRAVEKERRGETKKRKREEDEKQKEDRAKRTKVWKEYERQKKEELGEDVRVYGRVVEGEDGVLRVEPLDPPPPSPPPRSPESRREESFRRFAELLTREFEAVKSRIVEFLQMREAGNMKKAYMNDFMRDVGERVEGAIRKCLARLDAHFSFNPPDYVVRAFDCWGEEPASRPDRVLNWTVEEAAVRGVIGLLEYVFVPVEIKVTASTESGEQEEQVKVVEAPKELRAYGAKKKLGDLLYELMWNTEIDMGELIRWLKSDKDLLARYSTLLEKMAEAGAQRKGAENLLEAFGLDGKGGNGTMTRTHPGFFV